MRATSTTAGSGSSSTRPPYNHGNSSAVRPIAPMSGHRTHPGNSGASGRTQITYCVDNTGFVTSSANRADTTATIRVASRARSERQTATEPRKRVPTSTGSCSARSTPGAVVAASPTTLKENDPNATSVRLMPNAPRRAMKEPATVSIWSGRSAVNARRSKGVAPGKSRYAPNETRPTMATADKNLASPEVPSVRQACTANNGMRMTPNTFRPAASPRAMPAAAQCRAVAPQIAPRTSTAGRMS